MSSRKDIPMPLYITLYRSTDRTGGEAKKQLYRITQLLKSNNDICITYQKAHIVHFVICNGLLHNYMPWIIRDVHVLECRIRINNKNELERSLRFHLNWILVFVVPVFILSLLPITIVALLDYSDLWSIACGAVVVAMFLFVFYRFSFNYFLNLYKEIKRLLEITMTKSS